MYIVLEYFLLENFIINYLILYLTKILTRKDASNKRLALGALIASLYSLFYFHPSLIILTKASFKLILSVIIIRISFKFISYKFLLRELMGFYIISFIFAGASIGVFFSSKSYTGLFNGSMDNILNGFPIKYLFSGISISVLIVLLVFKFYKLRLVRDNFIAEVEIKYKENIVTLKGLIDTGNSLIDPISKNRVIVVEYQVLKDLLPHRVSELIKANDNNNYLECEKILDELKDDINLSIIPFKSIGKSGIMFSFKPECVDIIYNSKIQRRKDILIGIYSNNLSKEMGYSGLLHYELVNGGVNRNNAEIQTENILL